ncbi:GGDEF domain-containing protein [Methylobacterium terricola]|uniref:diguanylate cyclase n=1 Tax=Methylobacterium terricola TaxID=2583531 RepID=A0A5C4LCV9_9HYPH|nr:GGDEF domain-containing protein [Methylobacterium terricola]TNC10087.1 GGDEF domain-containing protein [Methylobacterium terricola]
MTQTAPRGGDLEAQLFDLAPTSLWLQDLGALKAHLDAARDAGMADLRDWLRDPGHLLDCQRLIRIVRVNRHTLATYEARDEAELFAHIPAIFHDPEAVALVEVLCQLWAGATQARLVTQNRTVGGRVIDVSYAGQLLPGHEADWARFLISIEDITPREEQRRQEEARLEALSLTDHLTGLINRAGLDAEIDRIERERAVPASVIVADLNRLKAINDLQGHDAGDAAIRRFADLLAQAVPPPARPARIGGDEFVVLLPGTGPEAAAALVQRILAAIDAADASVEAPLGASIDALGPSPLSAALGCETWTGSEPIRDAIARADARMYEAKRRHHAASEARDALWTAPVPSVLPPRHH